MASLLTLDIKGLSIYQSQVLKKLEIHFKGGFRNPPRSKLKLFKTVANGFQPLSVDANSFFSDVAGGLEPFLHLMVFQWR